jgi:hypothetical protein
MPPASKSNFPKRQTARKAVVPRGMPSSPPQILQYGQVGGIIRYTATSALASAPITWRCLQKLVFINTGTSTGKTFFTSFKVKYLRAWAPPLIGSSYNAPTTLACRVRTGDGACATEKVFSDVATNMKGAAIYVKFKSVGEDAGKWHDGQYAYANDSRLLNLDGPIGTIIDLAFSYRLATSSGSAVTLVTSSSTTGQICYNYLDNTSTSGTAGNTYIRPDNVSTLTALGY